MGLCGEKGYLSLIWIIMERRSASRISWLSKYRFLLFSVSSFPTEWIHLRLQSNRIASRTAARSSRHIRVAPNQVIRLYFDVTLAKMMVVVLTTSFTDKKKCLTALVNNLPFGRKWMIHVDCWPVTRDSHLRRVDRWGLDKTEKKGRNKTRRKVHSENSLDYLWRHRKMGLQVLSFRPARSFATT